MTKRACLLLVLLVGCNSVWSTQPPGSGGGGEAGGGVAGTGEHGLFGPQQACGACHQQAFDATTRPPHAVNNFSTTCEQCHTSEVVWESIAYSMHPARFPLEGKHAEVACTTCHGTSGTSGSSCASCHQADYDRTTMPAHAAGGIPTTCASCHSTSAWRPAGFDHANLGGQACASCHMTDYTATTNPNHQTGGFATTCQTCHTTIAWRPAGFDHSAIGTQTCVSCHQAAFAATTNPNHQMVGFPDTCATCHATTAWQPATLVHTWFPITSGRHAVACAQCHVTPTSYAQFSCLNGCHRNDHHQTGNALADSLECYRCHPQGRN